MNISIDQFLAFLAQSGESQRTVAQFEGMYLTLVALEGRIDKLFQPESQWAEDFNVWRDVMDALALKVAEMPDAD